jgi:hypothetical protein
MRVGTFEVEWRGDHLWISDSTGRAASGRWHAGKIVERSGNLAEGDDDSSAWQALEDALRLEAESLIASTFAAAYDERGVDVTQIDEMLKLSPRERLQVLDEQRRSILKLRRHAPRD